MLGKVGRIVVVAGAAADLIAQIVPFHAGDLACLAADALGRVDEFRHLAGMRAAHFRRWQGGCRAADDVERLQRHGFSYTFSTLTRNALNSGVCELASPTEGVSVLARNPGLARPMKPQWIGTPTVCTTLPSTFSGRMRLVTIATALMKPRFELTLTISPVKIPTSFARASPISTN